MRYYLILSVILLSAFISINALQHKVSGVVTDAAGGPVPGVTVKEKNTSNATSTDGKGHYNLTLLHDKSILVFTGAGFTSLEIPVNGRNIINVVMSQGAALQEVVVTGFNKRKQNYAKATAPMMKMEERFYSADRNVPERRHGVTPLEGRGTSNASDTIAEPGNFDTEDYDAIVENRFLEVTENPLSTFSIDVDAASYSNVRRYLESGNLPPAGSVRIEEMINYFRYNYPQPDKGKPFSINTETAVCPWNENHQLVMVGLQGMKVPVSDLPSSNLVFLIDVSGSMMVENKLPLVKSSMKLLVDQLREQDMVSLVVYAGSAGLVLPPTSGSKKQTIKDAIERLEAGGSTAGGEGIRLAYKTAREHFISEGNNRVILCTDGDFNVGLSSDASLESMIESERETGVYLTVLGFGMGNYKDNKMQKLADKGNGNHAYIDGIQEARKVLVNEFGGTLFTIAKDVKLQVEFNPALVQAYRLIGYENRMLQKEDFNDDTKDAGELGSGHTVTALYEVIPTGVVNEFATKVDKLKYQQPLEQNYRPASSTEMMTIKFRYKKPEGKESLLIEHPVTGKALLLSEASTNFRFVSAVAAFGMLLRHSTYKQNAGFTLVEKLAQSALENDDEGYRKEFLKLVKQASALASKQKGVDDVSQAFK